MAVSDRASGGRVADVGGPCQWLYEAPTNTNLSDTNFTPQFFQQTNNPGQWVGALTLRVPIKNEQ